MTVAELLEELKDMPQDAEVMKQFEDQCYGACTDDIWSVTLKDLTFQGKPYQEVWFS